MTEHLDRVAEHTLRIRSMAKFVERIGISSEREWEPFNIWAKRTSMVAICNEAVQLGMNDKAESIMQMIEVTDDIADIILFDERKDSMVGGKIKTSKG